MIIKFICKPKSSEANNKTEKQILFNKYMHFTNIIGKKKNRKEHRVEKNCSRKEQKEK